ncbi:glycerophosphodiester phosphodiesterase family protein [Burkholderia sp. Ac-20365]|uniref:glycerophosphodiester phosphodiesterase n=1 Tax=Burkholderia sp. Ac-20365 TaxID=2703897 RepID=UPI00197BE2F9|nr:glycerophosphodiester phosphodiesterase family protein [Burkholderia sp. Ac-20365]MBN3760754.1 glycerophosphodiester phosphodiesterase [Burkholderia sp. Ac-20365]
MPLRIARRGARGLVPENTIDAFRKAVELGSDMIEFDVHLSRDGHAVVMHDDTLVRCSDVKRRFPNRSSYFVSDYSLAELQSLDAGSWHVDQINLPADVRQAYLRTLRPDELCRHVSDSEWRWFESGNVRIPLLADALSFFAETEILINIELKTIPRMYPGIAKKVTTQIKHHSLETRVLISSFDHEQLLRIRALDCDMPTAVLTSDRLSALTSYLDAIDADAFHPGCYAEYDTLGFGSVDGALQLQTVAEVLASGRWVNAWTCNDESQISALSAQGLAGS